MFKKTMMMILMLGGIVTAGILNAGLTLSKNSPQQINGSELLAKKLQFDKVLKEMEIFRGSYRTAHYYCELGFSEESEIVLFHMKMDKIEVLLVRECYVRLVDIYVYLLRGITLPEQNDFMYILSKVELVEFANKLFDFLKGSNLQGLEKVAHIKFVGISMHDAEGMITEINSQLIV